MIRNKHCFETVLTCVHVYVRSHTPMPWLQFGSNKIEIDVIRGTSTRSYTLKLIRQHTPPDENADSEATLSLLQVARGPIRKV